MPTASHHSALAITLWIAGGAVVLAIAAVLLNRLLVRRGLRAPIVLRVLDRASDQVVDAIKRPIAVAVLDEVAEVLQTGHYTRNLAAALEENRDELKRMVAEKIKDDPAAGRINLVPFSDWIIDQTSETTFRVIFEVLADPRTDELVSDLLRENIEQLREAIRERAEEDLRPESRPDPSSSGRI